MFNLLLPQATIPIVVFPYHQPYLEELATAHCFHSNTEQVLNAFHVFVPHPSTETSCALKGPQAGPLQ